MSNFIQITPFMLVEDIEAALTFFTDILGFKALFREGNYAYIHRETVGFRILEQRGEERVPALGATPITSTFTMWISFTPNSSPSLIRCPRAMSTDPSIRSIASVSC